MKWWVRSHLGVTVQDNWAKGFSEALMVLYGATGGTSFAITGWVISNTSPPSSNFRYRIAYIARNTLPVPWMLQEVEWTGPLGW